MRFSSSGLELTTGVNKGYLLMVCSIAALAQFPTGYLLGGVNAIYNNYDILTTLWAIAVLLIGLIFGSLIVKYLCYRYGRRTQLIGSACILLVGTAVVKPT
jgi:MFS family permease